MSTDELAKTLKSYKGPIFVELGTPDNYVWVMVHKADLKRLMKTWPKILEAVYVVDQYGESGLYLGRKDR